MTLYETLKNNLFIMAGPCVIESKDICFEIAERAKEISEKYGFTYIFKASFDKANRTSASSFRGTGLEKGLEILQAVKDKFNVLNELKDILQLPKLPRKIESYDISNISGTFVVAGMCVMQDGIINKKLSRRFKIKTVIGQDDPKCINEVIKRRLKHSIEPENKSSFGRLPDVIFVDGGITQIKAAKQAIQEYNLNIPVYGMVKNDKHTTRALIDENKKEIDLSEELKNIITNFQDTVHDTAIEYHKKLRDNSITKSELDDIKGIGIKKKEELLRKFGSVKNIKKASIDDLVKINGINEELAKKIIENK